MKLTAWRVALRIARRDALRAKGRSALVVAMVALPVLGVAGADVVFRSAQLDPGERVVRTMGQADAEVRLLGSGLTVFQAPDPDDGTISNGPKQGEIPSAEQRRSSETESGVLIRQLLPAGSAVVPVSSGPYISTTSADGLIQTPTSEADLADPLWRGRVTVLGGRVPGAPREIAATQAFLDSAHLRIGDTTTPRGLEGKPYTITAAVEYPSDLGGKELIGRPGELIPALQALPSAQRFGRSERTGEDRWLVKLPAGGLDWPKVTELNKYGFSAASRSVLLDPPPRSEVPFYNREGHQFRGSYFDQTAVVILLTVAGMALLEIVLLAGPAFAVGARRSRRQLGLLAAGGGDRSHVRSVVLGGGVVLGVTGAAVGLVLAIGLVAALQTPAEEFAGRRFGHFDLQPLDLFGVMGIGLVTGLLAAVVPAVQASRQDVVSALTGRGSVKPANKKLAVLGLLMLAGGAALALLGATTGQASRTVAVLGGSMIAELGMVVLTPILVGLFGRLGRRLPLGPRLALRDSVRHRGRTAPAVAAVMAAVAGSVAVGVYGASSDEQHRQEYVATAPAGAVTLASGWGPASEGNLLPKLRTTVEAGVPELGPRADLSTVHFMGDCQQGSCGSVSVSVPKERRCPRDDPDNEDKSREDRARLSKGDPRCAPAGGSARYGTSWFGSVPAGDANALRNLFGVRDQAAEQALTTGKAVVFDEKYLKDGKITFDLTEPTPDDESPGRATPSPTPKGGATPTPTAGTPGATSAPTAGAVPGATPTPSAKAGATPTPTATAGATPAASAAATPRPVPAGPDGPQDAPKPVVHHVSVDAVLASASSPTAEAFMSPETAVRLGLTVSDSGSVWLPAKAPGSTSEQKTSAAVNRISESVFFEVERGYQSENDLVSLALTGFAGLVALGAAGIATGLAAADSQRDLTTLAAVGAAPRIRRTLSGFQCGVIAAMGAVLGTICGVVPAVALRKVQGNTVPYPGMDPSEAVDHTVVVFPWLNMGLTLLVLPLIAVALATLFTRSRIALLRQSG
ncbi:FtsX-like permease family protein [Kitasatospora sp. NPDC050543]|uniref:FtsX-like permease family protein n=1 Tax=Kitasatospora sp. NPDC050543 TaxID=3364054 RepID=UPI00378B7714